MRNHHKHSYRAGFYSHMVIHLNPFKQTLFLVFSFILSALIQRLLLSVRAIAALSFYLLGVSYHGFYLRFALTGRGLARGIMVNPRVMQFARNTELAAYVQKDFHYMRWWDAEW